MDGLGDIKISNQMGAVDMEQKKRKRGWLYALIAVALVGAGITYWNWQQAVARERDRYETYTLRQRDPLNLKGTAEVTQATSVRVDPAKGEVDEILVKSGQRVEQGDVLFTYVSEAVDNSVADARRQLTRSEAALAQAEADLAKGKKDQTEDKAALETAESRLARAKDRLRDAQKDLADAQADRDQDRIEDANDAIYEENDKIQDYSQDVSRLTARVDAWPGQITALEKAVDQSENVVEDARTMVERAEGNLDNKAVADFTGVALVHEENKANPQASLVDLLAEETEISATVTEYDYFRLSLGQAVRVHVIPTDEWIAGTVSELDPVPVNAGATGLAADTGVYYGFAVIPERSIQPGYSVEVEVALPEILVPAGSIVTEGEVQSVWLLRDGRAAKAVVTLEKQGNYWILTGGAAESDVLIQNPDADLTEGMEVKVGDQ